MAGGVRLSFKGGREMIAALERMDTKTARNVVTRAIRKAQTPLRDAIRARIKSQLTTMNARARAEYAKSIGISTRSARQGGVVGKIRTAKRRVKIGNRVTNFQPLAHLFEGGVAPHAIKQKKRTIDHPGISATPIWATTHDATANKMVDEFRDFMFDEIAKEWNRK